MNSHLPLRESSVQTILPFFRHFGPGMDSLGAKNDSGRGFAQPSPYGMQHQGMDSPGSIMSQGMGLCAAYL